MSISEKALKAELSSKGFNTDAQCLSRCKKLYEQYRFKSADEFSLKLESFAFSNSIRSLNEDCLDKFELFLPSSLSTVKKVDSSSSSTANIGDFDFDIGIDFEDLGFPSDVGYASPQPATNTFSELGDFDRKRKLPLEFNTPSNRNRPPPATPWSARLGSPPDPSITRHKDSGQVVASVQPSLPSIKSEFFDERGEERAEVHVIDLTKAKPQEVVNTSSKADESSNQIMEDEELSIPIASHDLFSSMTVITPLPTANIVKPGLEEKPFRYMTWSNSDNINIIDNHSERIIDGILESKALQDAFAMKKENMDDEEDEIQIANIDKCSNEEFYFVGRIKDSEPTSTRLTSNSVSLVGLKSSNFKEAVLRLGHSDLKHYELFPGQTVMARGTNSTGKAIVASSIFSETTLPHYEPTVTTSDVNIMYAAGPFSSNADSNNGPLSMLLNIITKATTPPDVLVLSGPFVDAEHPLLQPPVLKDVAPIVGNVKYYTKPADSPSAAADPHDIFKEMVDTVSQMLSQAGVPTKVVLIPSQRDLHHHNCFPQPAFRYNPDPSRFTCAPNPCLLDIGGVCLAATSADVMLELSKQEVHHKKISLPATPIIEKKENDETAIVEAKPNLLDKRIVRLLRHILSQQSLCPVSTFPIDYTLTSKANAALFLPYLPDVMLVPSKLKYFAEAVPVPGNVSSLVDTKDVIVSEQVIAVNPESLVKGTTPATYASITINKGEGRPSTRTKVEIIRL